jgi:hypothetical protein
MEETGLSALVQAINKVMSRHESMNLADLMNEVYGTQPELRAAAQRTGLLATDIVRRVPGLEVEPLEKGVRLVTRRSTLLRRSSSSSFSRRSKVKCRWGDECRSKNCPFFHSWNREEELQVKREREQQVQREHQQEQREQQSKEWNDGTC